MTRHIPVSKIRNIGIVAHVDAGKTTLTERVLFACGAIHKKGEVHDGTTTTDSHRIEKKRGVTITSAAVTCTWHDHEIHLIDTPGHVDFAVEVERSLRVLDGAVVVLDGVAGVEPQTESVWRRADRSGLPRIVFVNKLDRAGADLDRCVDDVRTRLGAVPAVVALPIVEHGELVGVVDVVAARALVWRDGVDGYEVEAVPDALAADVERARAALVALVAERSDDVLAHLVDGRPVPATMLREAVRAATVANALVPVLCGAAYRDKGVELLLDAVIDYLPSPADRPSPNGSAVVDDAPVLASAFKTVHDTFGATTLVRVYAGTLKKGDAVVSARSGKTVRVGRIVRVFADKRVDVDAAYAGDIAGLPGLALATGDTLSAKGGVALERFMFDPPVLALAIEPKQRADRDALGVALSRLLAEDPSLVVKTDEETGETTLAGMGELHLEVAVDKLRGDHGVDVVTSAPRVSYKETLTSTVEHERVWKKQGGGPGQFAKVRLRIGPASRGSGFVFTDELRGSAMPREFVPAVEEGVADALARGLTGFPVVDVAVALIDGAAHAVDSSPLAFRNCARACFLEGAAHASPRVLEPLMTVAVTVAEDRVGDVVGDLNRRRGAILAVDVDASQATARHVRAEVPLAEMFGYAGDLRSRTQGRGTFTMSLARMELVPESLARTLT